MVKYKMTLAGMVYQEGQLPLGGIDTPVIVLPEADWREMVRTWNRVAADATRGGTDDPCDTIDAIIQRTEQSNA